MEFGEESEINEKRETKRKRRSCKENGEWDIEDEEEQKE